jgi:hypothetical protein
MTLGTIWFAGAGGAGTETAWAAVAADCAAAVFCRAR